MLQLHAGDVVSWRCTYDMSGLQPGAALAGGYSSTPEAQQEQCTVALHYYPRIETMRGCTAALDDDVLLGENMCSSEAEDLLRIVAAEDQQFPMRYVTLLVKARSPSVVDEACLHAWMDRSQQQGPGLVWQGLSTHLGNSQHQPNHADGEPSLQAPICSWCLIGHSLKSFKTS